MKKRILLLAPSYLDIYKDIVNCLESKDFEVVWISDGLIKHNPYNKNDNNRHTKTIAIFQAEVDAFWDEKFQTENFVRPFDFFLAIDGFMVTPHLFCCLESNNSSIRKVLFLYDKVRDNYEIDMFFKYYSSVYSFDKDDSTYYHLNHLPIYWVPAEKKVVEEYDVFGMASFSWGTRYDVYRTVKHLSKGKGQKDFIKLYYPVRNKLIYSIKYMKAKVTGENFLSLQDLKDDLFTDQIMSPIEFREMIQKSRIILDTQSSYQDGLTARFMWALGLGKKIITTNASAIKYPFYSPEQIFILSGQEYEGLDSFLSSKFEMPAETRIIIDKFRIDNWVDTMLKNN